MNENENEKIERSEVREQPLRMSRRTRPVRKTQGQILQEALGLNPEDLKNIEAKLSIIKFLDYFSEETLDFIFKDRNVEQYITKISEKIEKFGLGGEEDKLLKKGFEDKEIVETVERLKANAEELAISKGISKSVDKRLKRLSLKVSAPLLAIAVIFLILPYIGIPVDPFLMFPLLCVFCMVPQLVKSSVVKKWYSFKEENRREIYTKNRDDFLVLKSYIGEVLANIRSNLLEMEVPLELIKFSLFNRDYENLKIINQKKLRGLTEYYVSFEYPEGMEPFPIPETLRQQYEKPLIPEKQKDEKNFVVLTEMKGKDGVITSFIPSLKDNLADKINQLLNDSEFTESPLKFTEIIPNYSEDMAIYCICGEITEISVINICNWKNKFKFYLFEGKQCMCGDQIYALSLMDSSEEIPEELKDIFS
ncbi:hypothetical protein ES705_16454 [subsurface metagenome]